MAIGKNIILGTAYKYPRFVFERFIKAVRYSGCASDIVLVISESDYTATLKQLFSEFGVEALPIESSRYHIQSYRYSLYSRILNDWRGYDQNSKVFITDVRDVLFQRDLFDYPFPAAAGLAVFEEDRRISECALNSRWIEDAFGADLLKEVSGNNILCSGTTLGSRAAMLQYLEHMQAVLDRVMLKPLRRVDGVDQGVHNVLVRKKLLPAVAICVHSNKGPIVTLQNGRRCLDSAGMVLNDLDQIAHVAHQVDRFDRESLKAIGDKRNLPMIDLIAASNIFYGEDALKGTGLD